MMDEVGGALDLDRIHFLGPVPYNLYLDILQVSSVHVYLTYPFVLSWSLIEAMASGCAIVGSATPPVEEVLEDGVNGLLVDFFSPDAIADRVDQVLDHADRMQGMRDAARATAIRNFDLKTRLMPSWLKLMDDLVNHRRPSLRCATPAEAGPVRVRRRAMSSPRHFALCRSAGEIARVAIAARSVQATPRPLVIVLSCRTLQALEERAGLSRSSLFGPLVKCNGAFPVGGNAATQLMESSKSEKCGRRSLFGRSSRYHLSASARVDPRAPSFKRRSARATCAETCPLIAACRYNCIAAPVVLLHADTQLVANAKIVFGILVSFAHRLGAGQSIASVISV